jgi:hypothetical protein
MRRSPVPAEGSVFLVPLPAGHFGIGVLVRANGNGRAYGEFFSPRVLSTSDVSIPSLRKEDAVLCCKFGDHGLHTRRWTVIGSIQNWKSNRWRLPRFSRPHESAGMRYVIQYDDNLNVISEVIAPATEVLGLPEDAQFGSGVVEVKLDRLLT